MSFVPHADEASWKQNGTSAARRSYTQRDYDLLGVGSWALEQGPAFRSDDSVSSKSSGDMHPKLAEYFRTSAEVSRIQDGIAKLEMKHSEESARRELLKDQHRPLEISDSTFERSFEWERSTLKMNLDNAYNKAQILKEECISLGLDVESTKQRRKSRTNLRQTISQPNLYSLNAWLQNNSGHADHVPAMVSGLMPTGESVQDLQQLAKLGVLEKFKALSVTGANNVLQRERRATKEPSLRSQEYPHSATVKETQPSSSSNGLRLSTRGRTQVPIRHELRDQPISRSLNGFQRQPRSFFTFGKVFLTLWAEPAGEKSMPHNSESPGSQTGKYVISNVRTFVIIREDVNHCIALPVQTYSGRGVAKPGIKKSDHCIVYSGPTPPLPRPDEAPSKGETGLQVWPIRVDAVRRGDKLDQMCRLNFGKTYTVEHNIKVRSFGMVNPAFQKQLLLQFRASWGSAVSSYSAEIPYAELKQSVQAQKSHTIPAYGLTPADVVANPNVSYDVNHGIGETQSSTQITAGSCPSVRSFNPNGSNQSGKTMRVRRASDSRSEDVQRGPPSSCSCLRCDKNFDTVLDRSKHERIHRERSFESPRAVEDDEESLNTGSDHVTCRSNTSDHFQERAIVQPQYENDTGLAEARSDQTTLRMASLLPGFESRSSVNTVEVSSQMPKLGVDGTFAWMKRMNAGQNDALLKPGNEWIERVKARDHVFILDDSHSASTYWNDMCSLLELLASTVQNGDGDGVELYFTNSREWIAPRTSSQLSRLARSIIPWGSTEISRTLGKVLNNYEARICLNKRYRDKARASKVTRPLTVYVLTDGIWAGGGEPPEVQILSLVELLKEYGLPREQIGLQFISFGKDPEGLKRLDKHATLDPAKDITDVESSDGNVWKMLLGSILHTFDDVPSEALDRHAS